MPRFDRLNQLANFLDDLPHDKFHMPEWCSEDSTDGSCGNAGCACGWAATIFHTQGWSIHGLMPWYNRQPGWQGFAEFFEIETRHALWITCHLCSGSPYLDDQPTYTQEYGLSSADDITPRHAADRIRKVITMLGSEVTEDYPVLTKAQPTTVKA